MYNIRFTTCSLRQVIGNRLSKSYERWDDDLELVALYQGIVIGVMNNV